MRTGGDIKSVHGTVQRPTHQVLSARTLSQDTCQAHNNNSHSHKTATEAAAKATVAATETYVGDAHDKLALGLEHHLLRAGLRTPDVDRSLSNVPHQSAC